MTGPVPRAAAVVVDGPRVLLIKHYVRQPAAEDCAICHRERRSGEPCPGHDYAVLPGGHVEAGESMEVAALRELAEETTLLARVERMLWHGHHHERPATYFLMIGVEGTPVLSGDEAEADEPTDSFELRWAGVDEFAALNLQPVEARARLRELLGA